MSLQSQAAPFLYTDSGTIIDTASNTVVGTLPISGMGVAVSPDSKTIYMTVDGGVVGAGKVYAISALTNKVIAKTSAGDSPTGVAVSPNGMYVYATNDYVHGLCTRGCNAGVFEISAATHKVLNVNGVGYSMRVAAAPNGDVYVVPSFLED
jgi:DNA-binding beta-propeller fold protein YncE